MNVPEITALVVATTAFVVTVTTSIVTVMNNIRQNKMLTTAAVKGEERSAKLEEVHAIVQEIKDK